MFDKPTKAREYLKQYISALPLRHSLFPSQLDSNQQRCGRDSVTEAFASYGAEFEEDELNVRDERFPFLTVFPRATVPGGTVELEDIRSSVAPELPPTYEELVAIYGLSE